MYKSFQRWFIPLFIFIFTISACQPAPINTATPSAQLTETPSVTSTPDGVNQIQVQKDALKGVTIQVWHPWFGVESNLFESQVRDFNQTNEWGITVQATSQITYGQLYENTTASLPTANRPQMVIALPENALAWATDSYVVDLNAYINDTTYGISATDLKDFPTIFLTQDLIGGKRLGMPAERSARLLLYDASWARQLGFDTAPRTADELRQQACAAHQSMSTAAAPTDSALGGWLVDTNPQTALSWLTAFGGGALEGNNYRFLTPKNIAALTFVKQLYDDGCAWYPQSDINIPDAFAARKALFASAGLEDLTDFSRSMATANNADEWTVMSYPGDAQSAMTIYGSSYVVLNSTPEKQLASWLFIRWLLAPERQSKWVEITGLLPLRNSEMDLLSDYKNTHPQWTAAAALIHNGQIQPQLASWQKVRVLIGDGFDAMFRSNTPAGRVAEILAIMDSTTSDLTK
jgi:ABC-type glycerol-3-phosphate transport system substrate-binding protein